MKMFVVALCLFAAAAAAPAAPCVDSRTAALRAQPALQHDEVRDEFGQYAFRYVTAEGTIVSQRGRLVPNPDGCGDVLVIEGETSYIGDDGKTYSTKYTAGLDGTHVEGAHLPVSVAVPADGVVGEVARHPGSHNPCAEVVPSTPPAKKNPCAEVVPSKPPAKKNPCVEVVPSEPPAKKNPCVEVVPTTPPAKKNPCVEVVPSNPPAKKNPCAEVIPSNPPAKKNPCAEVVPSNPPAKKNPCADVVPSNPPAKKNPCAEVAPCHPPARKNPCASEVHKKYSCE